MKVAKTQILALLPLVQTFTITPSNVTRLMSTSLRKTAFELFSVRNRITPSEVSELTKHGCWCSKFDLVSHPDIGGNPVDDLDRLCKNWFKSRNCLKLQNGSCHNKKIENYQLEDNTCILNSDSCTFDSCRVDLHFANQIEDFIGNFGMKLNLVFHDDKVCKREKPLKVERECTGEFPNFTAKLISGSDQEHADFRQLKVHSPKVEFEDYQNNPAYSPGAYNYDGNLEIQDSTVAPTTTTFLARAPKIVSKPLSKDDYVCNGKSINVMVIMDTFGIHGDELKRKLDFLQGVVSYLHLGEYNILGQPTNNLTFSLMTFAGGLQMKVSFQNEVSEALQAIEHIQRSESRGDLSQALLKASAQLRHHNTMVSRESQNIVIVFTDNSFDKEETLSAAKYLQNMSRVVAIGHGDSVKSGTLRLIASAPKNGNALVANSERIFRLIDILPRKICNSYRVL